MARLNCLSTPPQAPITKDNPFFHFVKGVLRRLGMGKPEMSATYAVFGDIFATVDVLDFDRSLVAGKPVFFRVRVSNSENGAWPNHGNIDLHLRWTTPKSDGSDSFLAETWKKRLPRLNPGENLWIVERSIVPENASEGVLIEFYISSLEGIWQKGVSRETRFYRSVKPATIQLPFAISGQDSYMQEQRSKAA